MPYLMTYRLTFLSHLAPLLQRFLPSTLVVVLKEEGPDVMLKLFDGESDTPELIWDGSMRAELRRVLAEELDTCIKDRKENGLGDENFLLQPGVRVKYSKLEDELFVGGVYVSRFLKEPTFNLRDPTSFLEKLLQRWTHELQLYTSNEESADKKSTNEVALAGQDALQLVTNASVYLCKVRPSLCDKLSQWGYMARCLNFLDEVLTRELVGGPLLSIMRILHVASNRRINVEALVVSGQNDNKHGIVTFTMRAIGLETLHPDAAFMIEMLKKIYRDALGDLKNVPKISSWNQQPVHNVPQSYAMAPSPAPGEGPVSRNKVSVFDDPLAMMSPSASQVQGQATGSSFGGSQPLGGQMYGTTPTAYVQDPQMRFQNPPSGNLYQQAVSPPPQTFHQGLAQSSPYQPNVYGQPANSTGFSNSMPQSTYQNYSGVPSSQPNTTNPYQNTLQASGMGGPSGQTSRAYGQNLMPQPSFGNAGQQNAPMPMNQQHTAGNFHSQQALLGQPVVSQSPRNFAPTSGNTSATSPQYGQTSRQAQSYPPYAQQPAPPLQAYPQQPTHSQSPQQSTSFQQPQQPANPLYSQQQAGAPYVPQSIHAPQPSTGQYSQLQGRQVPQSSAPQQQNNQGSQIGGAPSSYQPSPQAPVPQQSWAQGGVQANSYQQPQMGQHNFSPSAQQHHPIPAPQQAIDHSQQAPSLMQPPPLNQPPPPPSREQTPATEGSGIDARTKVDPKVEAEKQTAYVPGAPGAADGRVALLQSALVCKLPHFLVEAVLENQTISNVKDPAAVKVHSVELLKLLTDDPGYGMKFKLLLEDIPAWKKYKSQDHSLFITGPEQKADYFLTDGNSGDPKKLLTQG
jgi:hypothetical protein